VTATRSDALALLPGRRAWMDRAACRRVDPETFFPRNPEQARRARSVCERCPVVPECLDYASWLRTRMPSGTTLYGVWGGVETVRPRERA